MNRKVRCVESIYLGRIRAVNCNMYSVIIMLEGVCKRVEEAIGTPCVVCEYEDIHGSKTRPRALVHRPRGGGAAKACIAERVVGFIGSKVRVGSSVMVGGSIALECPNLPACIYGRL